MPEQRAYSFEQVDVFTERAFAGNPLAVFPHAEGLTGDEMQAIAREMNLSETTFVLPSSRPDCAARVRIFTPGRELPFAGHPTLGTAYVLAQQGVLPPGAREFALEEGVGPVPVRVEGDPAAPSFLWMRHQDATFGEPLTDRAAFAAALGLVEADLLPDAPIVTGTTAVAAADAPRRDRGATDRVYVPLRDRTAVDRAALDVPALLRAFAGANAVPMGVYVFAPEANGAYGRMFAPHTSGIPEDPATGSAVGVIAAWLAERGYGESDADGAVRLVCEQGTKMGRQSFLRMRATLVDGKTSGIEVGGAVVPVLDGTLRLPLGAGPR